MFESLFDDFDSNLIPAKSSTEPKKVPKKSNKIELKEDIDISSKSLFGDEYGLSAKDLIKKINTSVESNTEAEKVLKSKALTLEERLKIIKDRVLKTLGRQKENILVIRDRETLDAYINKAIEKGRVDIDTETNNSTDCVLAKLAGLCLYVPDEKQVYVPVNHRDPQTKERLENQLTEQDCREVLDKLIQNKVFKVFHNGKFDYEILKSTCGIEVVPDWDTMIAAWLMDENEFGFSKASLKSIYTKYIDVTQEKYSIDELFENISYLDVDPDIFALYAATDALMTDKVYLWEKPFYDDPANEKLNWVLHTIEFPVIPVTGDIELRGVKIDQVFGERLRQKYEQQLKDLDEQIQVNIAALEKTIATWKSTDAAAATTKIYVPKKTKMAPEKLAIQYPEIDEKGNRFKYGKPKKDQLDTPINLASPTQLAILFYDILNVSKAWGNEDGSPIVGVDKRKESVKTKADFDRKIGKDELKKIKDKLAGYLQNVDDEDFATDENGDAEETLESATVSSDTDDIFKFKTAAIIVDLMLRYRNLAKLVTTYFDVIPTLAEHWPDGRIRYKLNQAGTNTGRYSSGGKWHWLDENDCDCVVSGINSQNIPSRGDGKITRMLFVADTKYHEVEATNNVYEIPETDEVETVTGWVWIQDLKAGDVLSDGQVVQNIVKKDKTYLIYVEN